MQVSSQSRDVELQLEGAHYQLRGALTLAGGCMGCFLREMRDTRHARFSRITVREDGETVYFKADVTPPCSKTALIMAVRRLAESVGKKHNGVVTVWATPELVAEVHLSASGTDEDRLEAALSEASLTGAHSPAHSWAEAAHLWAAAVVVAWVVLASRYGCGRCRRQTAREMAPQLPVVVPPPPPQPAAPASPLRAAAPEPEAKPPPPPPRPVPVRLEPRQRTSPPPTAVQQRKVVYVRQRRKEYINV